MVALVVTKVAILPSPLLPASAYTPLSAALRSAGADSFIADPALGDEQTADDLVLRWSESTERSDVLVAHSNAGFLAPAVRARTDSPTGIVFMDAALLPAVGDSPLAPARIRAQIASLADERGVLPQWTRWWPRDTVRAVIPDDLFDAIDQDCPQLPVSYFDHRIDAPHNWASAANAYLAFGDTYLAELALARDNSWPNRAVDGSHLHFLHQPGFVADLVLTLARELC